jgi:hypothetical protein
MGYIQIRIRWRQRLYWGGMVLALLYKIVIFQTQKSLEVMTVARGSDLGMQATGGMFSYVSLLKRKLLCLKL